MLSFGNRKKKLSEEKGNDSKYLAIICALFTRGLASHRQQIRLLNESFICCY